MGQGTAVVVVRAQSNMEQLGRVFFSEYCMGTHNASVKRISTLSAGSATVTVHETRSMLPQNLSPHIRLVRWRRGLLSMATRGRLEQATSARRGPALARQRQVLQDKDSHTRR